MIKVLDFGSEFTGSFKTLDDDFTSKLKNVIEALLIEAGNPIPAIIADTFNIHSLKDIISWDKLLDAWTSAKSSYCHLPQKVTVHVEGKKVTIRNKVFRVGVCITDYHLIINNLFNVVFQNCLKGALWAQGLLTPMFWTKKPLHATLSINGFSLDDNDGGCFLEMASETENPLVFEHQNWQEPQNFPKNDFEKLKKSPWIKLDTSQLDLIKNHFVWDPPNSP